MLKDNKYTPALIGDLTFNIPLYQRMFRWGDEQIEQLLSDLLREYQAYKSTGIKKPYYIGMLTAHRNQYGDFDLIDGQQRFTVLMLIGIAFMGKEWSEFVEYKSHPRLSFFARPHSTDFIANAINTSEVEISDKDSADNGMMANGIKVIKRFLTSIQSYVDIGDFSTYIYNNLTFFISELPEKYSSAELNEYFEAMNSAGKGLENYDILKVDLLKGRNIDKSMYIKLWDLVSKMETRLHPHWLAESNVNYNVDEDKDTMMKQIEKLHSILANSSYDEVKDVLNILSCTNLKEHETGKNLLSIDAKEHNLNSVERDNERSVLKFPELLLFTLKMHSPNNTVTDFYNVSFLLDRFVSLTGGKRQEKGMVVSYSPASDDEVKRFYVELLYYRMLLDYYVVRIKGRNEARRYTSLFTKSTPDDGEFNEKPSNRLNMYQAMLSVSTTWHLWLAPTIKWLDENLNTDVNQFLSFLKTSDNKRHPNVPDNLSYKNKEGYWYWRLDYYLWETYRMDKDSRTELDRKIDRVYRAYVFRANRSIEHFHPQNEDYYEDKWGDKVNIFGNLALISPEFNSTQSNDNFADKMSRIENRMNSGMTESLKLVEMFRIAKIKSVWSFDYACKHEGQMMDILNKSYLHYDEAHA